MKTIDLQRQQSVGIRFDFGGEKTTHVCLYLSSTPPCQSGEGDVKGGGVECDDDNEPAHVTVGGDNIAIGVTR